MAISRSPQLHPGVHAHWRTDLITAFLAPVGSGGWIAAGEYQSCAEVGRELRVLSSMPSRRRSTTLRKTTACPLFVAAPDSGIICEVAAYCVKRQIPGMLIEDASMKNQRLRYLQHK